jgi:hypothetical protein
VIAQRVLAVVLTVLLFAVIVFGAGAIFGAFGQRGWGYLIGGAFCLVMVAAGLLGRRGQGPDGR